MEQQNPQREYKDRLFRFIFSYKENALSLYNAINGTDYDDPDALTFVTLDDVIYMNMKNDLAFILSPDMTVRTPKLLQSQYASARAFLSRARV